MGMNDISSFMVLSIILSMPFSISSKNGTQGPHGKFKLIKNRLQKLFRKIKHFCSKLRNLMSCHYFRCKFNISDKNWSYSIQRFWLYRTSSCNCVLVFCCNMRVDRYIQQSWKRIGSLYIEQKRRFWRLSRGQFGGKEFSHKWFSFWRIRMPTHNCMVVLG